MLYEVLHQRPKRPSWLIGETKEERVERMRSDDSPKSDRWYPGSYPRRVVSVRSVEDVESGQLPSLRNMAGDMLRVSVLDLDDEGRQGAASRTLKVKGDRLIPVTFDDRLGAVAAKMRERHADPEQWEIDERERVTTEEAENETRRKDYKRAREEYKVLRMDLGAEIVKATRRGDAVPVTPKSPTPLVLREVAPSAFDAEVARLSKALPPAGGATDA